MITPAMLRQAAEVRPPTAADAERRRARADSNLRADAPEFLPAAAPVVPPEPELVCEQCLNPMREVGELIKCNHLCEKMLCADCYPPPCHEKVCGQSLNAIGPFVNFGGAMSFWVTLHFRFTAPDPPSP